MWAVQARNFAKRENYTDAVARMKLVRSSIEDALTKVTAPSEIARLEGLLARADDQLGDLEAEHESWRARIAARRQQTIDGAAEEMARPLPTQAD